MLPRCLCSVGTCYHKQPPSNPCFSWLRIVLIVVFYVAHTRVLAAQARSLGEYYMVDTLQLKFISTRPDKGVCSRALGSIIALVCSFRCQHSFSRLGFPLPSGVRGDASRTGSPDPLQQMGYQDRSHPSCRPRWQHSKHVDRRAHHAQDRPAVQTGGARGMAPTRLLKPVRRWFGGERRVGLIVGLWRPITPPQIIASARLTKLFFDSVFMLRDVRQLHFS